MTRIGLGALVETAAREALDHYRSAEALGYESLWLTETRFTRDAITTAASAATVTDRIGIGTGAINPYTRNAALLAVTFATLAELSGGRAIAGIGAGSPSVLTRQGIAVERPLQRLRETVEVMRRLWRGERVTYQGETIRLEDVALDFEPPRREIPVYLAVTGPRALELAGEIADGVLLNSFVSPGYIRQALLHIARGATRAGRSLDEIDIAGSVEVSLHADPATARDAIRPALATYLASFAHIARQSGFSEGEIQPIRAAYETGGAERAAQHVTDAMVETLAVAGDAADCRRGLEVYREAGLQLPVIDVVAANIEETIEAMITQ